MWARLVSAIDATAFTIIDSEPTREVHQGLSYAIRLKRHSTGDRISAYPTEGSSAFYSHTKYTLDGLEQINFALGYMWDADLREMGEPVMSFRDGKVNPVWAIILHHDASNAHGFSYAAVSPSTPEFDLSGIISQKEEQA